MLQEGFPWPQPGSTPHHGLGVPLGRVLPFHREETRLKIIKYLVNSELGLQGRPSGCLALLSNNFHSPNYIRA